MGSLGQPSCNQQADNNDQGFCTGDMDDRRGYIEEEIRVLPVSNHPLLYTPTPLRSPSRRTDGIVTLDQAAGYKSPPSAPVSCAEDADLLRVYNITTGVIRDFATAAADLKLTDCADKSVSYLGAVETETTEVPISSRQRNFKHGSCSSQQVPAYQDQFIHSTDVIQPAEMSQTAHRPYTQTYEVAATQPYAQTFEVATTPPYTQTYGMVMAPPSTKTHKVAATQPYTQTYEVATTLPLYAPPQLQIAPPVQLHQLQQVSLLSYPKVDRAKVRKFNTKMVHPSVFGKLKSYAHVMTAPPIRINEVARLPPLKVHKAKMEVVKRMKVWNSSELISTCHRTYYQPSGMQPVRLEGAGKIAPVKVTRPRIESTIIRQESATIHVRKSLEPHYGVPITQRIFGLEGTIRPVHGTSADRHSSINAQPPINAQTAVNTHPTTMSTCVQTGSGADEVKVVEASVNPIEGVSGDITFTALDTLVRSGAAQLGHMRIHDMNKSYEYEDIVVSVLEIANCSQGHCSKEKSPITKSLVSDKGTATSRRQRSRSMQCPIWKSDVGVQMSGDISKAVVQEGANRVECPDLYHAGKIGTSNTSTKTFNEIILTTEPYYLKVNHVPSQETQEVRVAVVTSHASSIMTTTCNRISLDSELSPSRSPSVAEQRDLLASAALSRQAAAKASQPDANVKQERLSFGVTRARSSSARRAGSRSRSRSRTRPPRHKTAETVATSTNDLKLQSTDHPKSTPNNDSDGAQAEQKIIQFPQLLQSPRVNHPHTAFDAYGPHYSPGPVYPSPAYQYPNHTAYSYFPYYPPYMSPISSWRPTYSLTGHVHNTQANNQHSAIQPGQHESLNYPYHPSQNLRNSLFDYYYNEKRAKDSNQQAQQLLVNPSPTQQDPQAFSNHPSIDNIIPTQMIIDALRKHTVIGEDLEPVETAHDTDINTSSVLNNADTTPRLPAPGVDEGVQSSFSNKQDSSYYSYILAPEKFDIVRKTQNRMEAEVHRAAVLKEDEQEMDLRTTTLYNESSDHSYVSDLSSKYPAKKKKSSKDKSKKHKHKRKQIDTENDPSWETVADRQALEAALSQIESDLLMCGSAMGLVSNTSPPAPGDSEL